MHDVGINYAICDRLFARREQSIYRKMQPEIVQLSVSMSLSCGAGTASKTSEVRFQMHPATQEIDQCLKFDSCMVVPASVFTVEFLRRPTGLSFQTGPQN